MNFDAINIEVPQFVDLIYINKIKDVIGEYIKENLSMFVTISRVYDPDTPNYYYGDAKYKILQFNNILTYMYMFSSNKRQESPDFMQFTITIDGDSVEIYDFKFLDTVARPVEDKFLGQDRKFQIINEAGIDVLYNLFHDKMKFNTIRITFPKNILFKINSFTLHKYNKLLPILQNKINLVFTRYTKVGNNFKQSRYDDFKKYCVKQDISLSFDSSGDLWYDNTYYDPDKRELTITVGFGNEPVHVDKFQFVSCNTKYDQKILRIV